MSLNQKIDAELRLEDKLRKKAVAHYDCRSVTVDFNCPSRYRILHQRRNTTTGASAASLVAAHQQQLFQQQQQQSVSAKQNGDSAQNGQNGKKTTSNGNGSYHSNHHQLQNQSSIESNASSTTNENQHGAVDDMSLFQGGQPDYGDGRENDLVANCPFFRNELGGEQERIICLNRLTSMSHRANTNNANSAISGNGASNSNNEQQHRPSFVCGISIIEHAQKSQVNDNNDANFMRTCPYQKCLSDDMFAIDYVDTGATYYRDYFYGLNHQNWFGKSENYGPLAISIRKERLPPPPLHSLKKSPLLCAQTTTLTTSALSQLPTTMCQFNASANTGHQPLANHLSNGLYSNCPPRHISFSHGQGHNDLKSFHNNQQFFQGQGQHYYSTQSLAVNQQQQIQLYSGHYYSGNGGANITGATPYPFNIAQQHTHLSNQQQYNFQQQQFNQRSLSDFQSHHNTQNHAMPVYQHHNAREKSSSSNSGNDKKTNIADSNPIKFQYRIIIRTSELAVLRGTVYEDCIPALMSSTHTIRNSNGNNNGFNCHSNNNQASNDSSNHSSQSHHDAKEVLEYLLANTDIQIGKLRLAMPTANEQLLKLDEHKLTKNYKVGVLYCKAGQSTEEEFYNNEHSGPLFEEFLECLGERVRLKGFDKYRAGLDNRTDTTGLYSVYANYADCEIMFHVSTLLPYQPNNRQQLLRKRHIGNNIVTIVFQEHGSQPFSPKTIRSQFQHVFIIVRALPPQSPSSLSESPGDHQQPQTRYCVSVSRSKEMPPFGPPIPEGATFIKSKLFTNFLLAKIINAENAAHKYCEKFATMAQRTRLGLLMDLHEHYATTTTLNDVCNSHTSTGVKIVSSIFGGGKKRNSARRYANFCGGDSAIQGAIVWEVLVEDFGQSKNIDCLIAISSAYLVIVEEQTKETIYVAPVESILGWTSHPSWIRIFCHQGECLFLRCKDPDIDEIAEIVTRLKAVSNGCETRELILRRSKSLSSSSSLGFDIQQEGIVTNVEPRSIAWQAGLSPGSRVVELCKAATATLDYPLIMDLIKTSIVVTITVLPPNPDGSPRIGCMGGYACAHQSSSLMPRPNSTFSSASANTFFSKPRSRRGTNLITLV